ncbi:30S ribosomal protein S7 [Striga asiatica]|uniref:30S ribosomal protein S7 n=1 Tax=Striga asiatica TaxID=4170 RepID=A0A5A7QEN4_STRAF|nr:30S ribosomal protein S7 [Striga asiatica]GER44572.1 30S ribosomal protein S7 [Striga asiatica]
MHQQVAVCCRVSELSYSPFHPTVLACKAVSDSLDCSRFEASKQSRTGSANCCPLGLGRRRLRVDNRGKKFAKVVRCCGRAQWFAAVGERTEICSGIFSPTVDLSRLAGLVGSRVGAGERRWLLDRLLARVGVRPRVSDKSRRVAVAGRFTVDASRKRGGQHWYCNSSDACDGRTSAVGRLLAVVDGRQRPSRGGVLLLGWAVRLRAMGRCETPAVADGWQRLRVRRRGGIFGRKSREGRRFFDLILA